MTNKIIKFIKKQSDRFSPKEIESTLHLWYLRLFVLQPGLFKSGTSFSHVLSSDPKGVRENFSRRHFNKMFNVAPQLKYWLMQHFHPFEQTVRVD